MLFGGVIRWLSRNRSRHGTAVTEPQSRNRNGTTLTSNGTGSQWGRFPGLPIPQPAHLKFQAGDSRPPLSLPPRRLPLLSPRPGCRVTWLGLRGGRGYVAVTDSRRRFPPTDSRRFPLSPVPPLALVRLSGYVKMGCSHHATCSRVAVRSRLVRSHRPISEIRPRNCKGGA